MDSTVKTAQALWLQWERFLEQLPDGDSRIGAAIQEENQAAKAYYTAARAAGVTPDFHGDLHRENGWF